MNRDDYGVMYPIIHNRIKARVHKDNRICKKELFTLFGRVYHIPKNQRFLVLNELIDLRMVGWVKRGVLEVF